MTDSPANRLRSAAWFVGDDEVALAHRVVLRSVGVDGEIDGTRPVIGIADSSSELNPCNLPLASLAEPVAAGVRAAGGIPLRFPVMSLGEDLMKPTAMLYRNQLSMESRGVHPVLPDRWRGAAGQLRQVRARVP